MSAPTNLPPPDYYAAARALWERVCPAPVPPVGARCVSVRSVPHARWMYCAPAVYEVRARKSDGALTWRCVDSEPVGRYRSPRKATSVGVELAARLGIPMLDVRHGRRA